jgi:phenylacetate-CoA ligase
MNQPLLRMFHSLPAPVRTAAASLHGAYLGRWRYGPETDGLVAEALERDRWSAEQWRRWREARLGEMLHRAATRVPYYRTAWAARRRRGDRASWLELENWPVLQKSEVRRHPAAFVADDCNPRQMHCLRTSGSTGTPLLLWRSRDTDRQWYAICEARYRRWYGLSRRDRWGMLGGQLIAPVGRRDPPFWVWNAGLNQLYLSAYHLAPDLIPHYLDALHDYRVRYLWGYSSALEALARGVLESGAKAPPLQVAISNAEPLLPHQRTLIGSAFGCPVRENYGMAEIVAGGSECEAGALHVWAEVGWTEVLEDFSPTPAPAGTVGRLVCTGLLNSDMPLVRYEVGDRAAIDAGANCRCGRTLPVLSQIEGRLDDAFITRDRRVVGRLDPVFKGRLPVREAQFVQHSLDEIRVRVVPDREFGPGTIATLTSELRARLGPVQVIVEPVASIPRGPNGKFRSMVCQLTQGERARCMS